MPMPRRTTRDLSAHLIKQVLYPLWALKNGSARLRYLDELQKSQYWTRQSLLDRQWLQFKLLFAHAYESCPYYRHKYDQAGITPDDLRIPDDISRVPTITKEEIQQHSEAMISSHYKKEHLIADMTGGSTGSPLQFYYDSSRLDSRVGATLRHNRWAGWDLGDRAAILWGAPQDMTASGNIKDQIRTWIQERRIILDASALNEEAMARFARELARYKPDILQAYANTLGLFARYLQSEKIAEIRPRGIICSAEVLTDENRRLIEATFDCPVFNRYGCREFAVIASECEAHRGMHINAENLFVEAVHEERSLIDKEGEIVITDLRNYAMPMIRYRIRDMGRISSVPCACSRGLPLMEISGGRVTDFLLAVNGSKVSGIVLATYVITNIPGIHQVQFVQSEPGAVTINLVKGPEWSSRALDQLSARTRKYLGENMQLRVEFRDRIPLGKSGKYPFTISSLT